MPLPSSSAAHAALIPAHAPPTRRRLCRARRQARRLAAGLLVSAIASIAGWAQAAPPADSEDWPTLEARPERSLDGVYRLEWSDSGSVRVEEARRPDFSDALVVYQGADQATTLSGRADGIYHYRIRPVADPVANAGFEDPARDRPRPAPAPVRVEVAHHPLPRAFGFFGVGLVVFLATVWLVVTGDRQALDSTDPSA